MRDIAINETNSVTGGSYNYSDKDIIVAGGSGVFVGILIGGSANRIATGIWLGSHPIICAAIIITVIAASAFEHFYNKPSFTCGHVPNPTF